MGGNAGDAVAAGSARPYLPRVVDRHLLGPGARSATVEATLLHVDIAGFTALSERLARRGRLGAEELADAIDASFSSLLAAAYGEGGSLVKFGGDALLLLFEDDGHAERAARAAVVMRRMLRAAGPVVAGGSSARLRMTAGLHSGRFTLLLVGATHRELVITGPAVTQTVRAEQAARVGEIVVTASAAAPLPPRCAGAARGPGRLLVAPPPAHRPPADESAGEVDPADLAACLSTELRGHVLAGGHAPEHRPVTVAFVGFTGTDELLAGSGPEAAADVVEALMAGVQRVADAHQICFLGTDVDADGGKVILTAGAPRLVGHEEDRMLSALRELADGSPPLPLAIGLHRGDVFAGDIGPHYRRTYTVMGDTVNVAARLMGLAGPGRIVASDEVVRRSDADAELVPLRAVGLRGRSMPVTGWSVGRVRGRRAPADAAPAGRLVGRAGELAALEAVLADARASSGAVVVEITGDAAIGKTSLAAALRERAEDAGWRTCRSLSGPYSTATPYAAWRDPLRRLAGIDAAADEERAGALLTSLADTEMPDVRPWLPLLGVAMGVRVAPTPATDALGEEFREARLQEAVGLFLRARAASGLLVEFEDAQFLDAASADLVAAVSAAAATPCVLVLLRRRPGTAPPGTRRLALGPLTPDESATLAEQLTEDRPLPDHVARAATERSGGNPGFLEDLIAAAAAGDESLPEDIEAAATAQIDRLAPDDRALVRRAAVLGTTFERDLFALATGVEVDDELLGRLAGIFAPAPAGRLAFRHEVVREAAYEGLPYATRRRIHRTLVERLGARATDEQADVLSRHLLLAGDRANAWLAARTAARLAWSRSAAADAAALYRRALGAAHGLDVPAGERADLWEELALACARIGAVDEAAAALGRARRLVGDDPLRTARLLQRHATLTLGVGRAGQAVRWAQRALRTLDGLPDDAAGPLRALVLTTLAAVRTRQSRFDEAIVLCERAVAAAGEHPEPGTLAWAYQLLDWALSSAGRAGEATHSAQALELARSAGDPERESSILNNLGGLAYWRGDWSQAVEFYRQGMRASERAGDAANTATGALNIGEVLSDQGRYAEAEEHLRRALRTFRGADSDLHVVYGLRQLGRTLARSGDHDQAEACFAEAGERLSGMAVPAEELYLDALVAEAIGLRGDHARALDAAETLVARVHAASSEDAGGGGSVLPLVLRVRGLALAALGRDAEAREALERSLDAAERVDAAFDQACAIEALKRIGAASPERRAERDRIRERLGIVRMPPLGPAREAGRER